MAQRMAHIMPYVTPQAFVYLTEALPPKVLLAKPSLMAGAWVAGSVRSLLAKSDYNAWCPSVGNMVRPM